MKALTLWQPWASLVALGVKTIETRSWTTSYRGPLAIHAAKHPVEPMTLGPWRIGRLDVGAHRRMWRTDEHARPHDLPLGMVIATCTLIEIVPMLAPDDETNREPHLLVAGRHSGRMGLYHPTEELHGPPPQTHPSWECEDVEDQRPFGDFRPGRYAWILARIQPIEPVPARGFQQLWEWNRAAA